MKKSSEDIQARAIKSALKSAVFRPLTNHIDPSSLENIAALGVDPGTIASPETVVATLRGAYDRHSVFEVVMDYLKPEAGVTSTMHYHVSVIENNDRMSVIMPADAASNLQHKLQKDKSIPGYRPDLH
jgi:hypothetical protein